MAIFGLCIPWIRQSQVKSILTTFDTDPLTLNDPMGALCFTMCITMVTEPIFLSLSVFGRRKLQRCHNHCVKAVCVVVVVNLCDLDLHNDLSEGWIIFGNHHSATHKFSQSKNWLEPVTDILSFI